MVTDSTRRPPLAGVHVASLLILLLGAGLVASEPVESTSGDPAPSADLAAHVRLLDAERVLEPLQAGAAANSVVVSLKPSTVGRERGDPGGEGDDTRPPDALHSAESRALLGDQIAAEQDWVLAQLRNCGIAVRRRFRYQFGFAVEVSLDGRTPARACGCNRHGSTILGWSG